MSDTTWERVCAAAKPGDTLRLVGIGLKMTGQLIRGGRVLRTVRWTSARCPRSREPEVVWSDWERQPNGVMTARQILPEELSPEEKAAPRPRVRSLDFDAWLK